MHISRHTIFQDEDFFFFNVVHLQPLVHLTMAAIILQNLNV